mmetsp:Transcript_72385/g.205938  ORF Transcript_72385/g.205938 Transcript_72385/m.205938 type:complete len:455 (-) Transcript_72385:443-1807(-)
MASYENGAVRHTPHSNGHSNGHSNQVVSNPMVGPNGQEPMRVAFFTASYFVLDGVTLTIRKLLAALKQAGCETLVITAAPTRDTMGELGALEGENLVLVPGMPVPLDNEHYGYALGLGLSREARRRLEDFKPHVAHFTVCDLLGMDGVKWAEANNVATVGTWHSNYCDYLKFYSSAWWLTPVVRRYIQQFYGAIPTTYVPTEYMRKKLTTEGYHYFTDMQIWGRGVDLDRFNVQQRSLSFRRHHGVKEDELLIIWVGRLVPEKRPDVWRDVVKRLHEEGRPVKGMVVGVGPCQNMFEGMSYVTVKGWLSGMALAEAYASSDILLFPSDVETFGNVTLEALACGVPSVVEHNCSQHLVTDGCEGYAVHQGVDDPDDKEQYAACVDRYYKATKSIVDDESLRRRFAHNARLKAETYSNRAVQQRMVDNYQNGFEVQIRKRTNPGALVKFRRDALHW